MTRTLAGLCAATALGFVATLGAQAPEGQPGGQKPTTPPSTQSPTTQKPSTSAAGNEIKVTGCLAKDATGFMLNSAMVEAPTPAATGTTGTAGTAGAAATIPANIKSATSFRVQGPGLDTHVGQRIEVTGAATAPAASTAPGAGAGGAKEGAAGAAGAAKPPSPSLSAKSVRMVSEKC